MRALRAVLGARFAAVRVLAALVVALCALGLTSASAFADGDPASDYLLNQQTFMIPESLKAPAATEKHLREVVKSANEHGFEIRVAVIAAPYDLGAITELWKKPQTYARFLGIELSLAYKGRLVVAMPNGLGFYWHGHSTAAEYKALSSVKPGTGASELSSAADAVERLAAAAGTHLSGRSSPHAGGSTGKGESDLVLILVAAAAFAMIVAFSLRWVEQRRRRGYPASATESESPEAVANPSSSAVKPSPVLTKPSIATAGSAVAATAVPSLAGADGPLRGGAGAVTRSSRERRSEGKWLRIALPVFALVLIVGGGAAILALSKRSTPRGVPAQNAAVVGTPFTWAADKRPAPEFHLTSQNGQPISLSQYRGRPVFVTFIDPTCRNLCPLEAKVLNEIDRKLPAAKRPAILAVSVNVYSDSHADLMEDFSRWKLVPQWHWAVGKLANLETVWKHYYAEVEVTTKKIAGVTAHYITHSEMAYLIDGKGDERALFSWPFNAKDVDRTLAKIDS